MSDQKPKPISIITIGMAGAGKSTFVQRINSYLHSINKPPYILNLDPAVTNVPFEPNIDIRDTINYQQVMKKYVITTQNLLTNCWIALLTDRYNLGPNGGILTALNLFTTKFDQVLDIVEKRADDVELRTLFSLARFCSFYLQLCDTRHARSNRNLHLVSIRGDHNRRYRIFPTYSHSLHHRHTTDNSTRNVHVKHAIRVQHLVQNQTSLYPRV